MLPAPKRRDALSTLLTPRRSHHHIFFDDNIHNRAEDSIIALRVRESEGQPFVAVSGELTRRLHGAFLRKVPTWEPILDVDWFVAQVAACEAGRRRILDEAGGALWAELRRLVRAAAAIRAAGEAGQGGAHTAAGQLGVHSTAEDGAHAVAGDPADAPAGAPGSAPANAVPGCRQCESAAGKRAPVLWQDDLWAVVHKQPPCGVVGHLQLIAKRHFQGPSAFTDREAMAVGLVLRRCERALERATGCDRVYTAALGSPGSPHFHAHMVPVYAASGGIAKGQPPIPLTGTPFDAFLQEKLAKDGVQGAAADPTQCMAAAAAWMREMETERG
jgi:diadenosine tetraphosphate (Ap4A) HIT family hydrolase